MEGKKESLRKSGVCAWLLACPEPVAGTFRRRSVFSLVLLDVLPVILSLSPPLYACAWSMLNVFASPESPRQYAACCCSCHVLSRPGETIAGAAAESAGTVADGWHVADRAAEVAPNMLLLPLQGTKSCVFMEEAEEALFPEGPSEVDEYGAPTSCGECGASQLDIALLPASASLPSSPGVNLSSSPADAPPRALGANATCVAYAVRPGVVRVVRVLDHQALEAASVCRVSPSSLLSPWVFGRSY